MAVQGQWSHKPRQVVVLSGKGGTGKTTVAASFAALAQGAVAADCDVDAANLYLLLNPQETWREEFRGAKVAVRDEELCTRCGLCEEHCRFDAITVTEIHEARCEGCGLCVLVCPTGALRLEEVVNGTVIAGQTRYGPLVYARLEPGAENSGRLATRVRQAAENVALEEGRRLIIIDGPPGIGCTVAASITDTDLAVVVAEPTVSGMHDMERVVQVAGHFDVPVAAIINKWDINPENSARIEQFCVQNGIPILAKLPYDSAAVQAVAQQVPVVEFYDGPVARGIRQAFGAVKQWLFGAA